MSKEQCLVYRYHKNGRYLRPLPVAGLREAAEFAISQSSEHPEVRVCDLLDRLVLRVVGGKIVFPESVALSDIKPVKQSDGRAHPYVVFAVELPSAEGDLPELSLPFAHAVDVEEAVKMVEEGTMDDPHYVVVDAMDYERLMEIADMLEEEEPSYPISDEADEAKKPIAWRPLDIGWAVRQLKKGIKVRFHTWEKGEYIENRGGRIFDKNGFWWRPSQFETLSSGWEVANS